MKGAIAAVALLGTLASCGNPTTATPRVASGQSPVAPATSAVASPPIETTAAQTALTLAAQRWMDAAVDGNTGGVLKYLDRDCSYDPSPALKVAARIQHAAHGVHPQIKAVFVIGTMGGVVDWTVPANARKALKNYVRIAPVSHTNDWIIDSHGRWAQETSCTAGKATPLGIAW